jgi:hypothetical protein
VRPAPILAPVDLDFWSYNLDNGRSRRKVRREVEAILSNDQLPHLPALPAVLIGQEAGRYHFHVRGYTLLEDRSTKSRANVVAWVRNDLARPDTLRWIDLRTTWPRPKYAWLGRHEPRSYPAFMAGRIAVIGLQQPPPNLGRLTEPAQREGIDRLAPVMGPWLRRRWHNRESLDKHVAQLRPRVTIGDFNRRAREDGPGPAELAGRVGGHTVGNRIDCAVVAGDVKVSHVDYPQHVNGVRLGSDHGHAFRMTLTVDERWTHTPKES